MSSYYASKFGTRTFEQFALYNIQDELLKSSSTQFAGVIAGHPLTDELYMRVVSNNPLKDIIKATNTVIEGAAELKKLLGSKIKVN